MNRILVIGATGNVGRHVVSQLAARGAQCRAMTRNPRHIVFLTAPLKTPHPFFQQPNPSRDLAEHIEHVIETSGLEWTFLRAGIFAGNARHFWAPQIRAGDIVRWPYLNAPTAPIDERDVAAAAVRALCVQPRTFFDWASDHATEFRAA